jgi:membrane protein
MFRIIKGAFRGFKRDSATTLAAALAYYTALSMAPLLVLVLAIVGTVWSDAEAQRQLIAQLRGIVGDTGVNAIQAVLAQASRPSIRGVAAIASTALLLFSASTVFAQLQFSLNRIWDVEIRPGGGVRRIARKRATAIAMVFGVALLLLVSLIASAALSFAFGYLGDVLPLPGGETLWRLLNTGITLVLFSLVFALMFYYVPDVKVRWRYAALGGLVTALLFTIGKEALALYLGRESVGSAYGAAGSLFVLLLWVYYSSLIFFFGAELTQAYAAERGDPIVPDDYARFIVPHAGIATREPEAREHEAPTRGTRDRRAGRTDAVR